MQDFRLRRTAHSALKQLTSARSTMGLQAPICDSVKTWADQHGLPSQLILPTRQFERSLPHTVEPVIHPEYLDRRSGTQAARHLVPVNGARLVGRNGLVVLPDRSFAAESVYGRPQVESDPGYYMPRRRHVVAKSGNYFSLVVNWAVESGGNYYHWLHDTLERLYGVAPLLPADTVFIVPANLKPFQHETLRLVGVEEHQVAYFSGEQVWELETLHFAPATRNSGSHLRAADEWLRDKILDGLGITPATGGRRIFVSRRLMPTRRVVNEDEVEAYLRQYGFETWAPETLPFRDQVELFSQAEMVVSTHGSAFTNMLFSPLGLTVLDMIQPDMLSVAYVFWAMALELGHDYWYLNAGSVPHAGQQDDTFVPIEKLAATIDRLGL
jgi:Glycosyltransferase 61